MFYYILKLVIMLPVMAGMIYGALWLYRKYQPGMMTRLESDRSLKLVETMSLGVSGKLAVVEFNGEQILLAVSRQRIDTLARQKGTDTDRFTRALSDASASAGRE